MNMPVISAPSTAASSIAETRNLLARAARTSSAALRQAPDATYAQLQEELRQLAHQSGSGHPAGAGAALQLLLARLQLHADPRCTGLMVFASALLQRVSGGQAADANLYLRRFEVPQIELFNLLGRCMPVATQATQVANRALVQAMQGQVHPVVVDVGIGTGRQMVALMEQLAAAGRLPPQMTVVGIEPAQQALNAARDALCAAALRLGTRLRFHGFAACAEAMSSADWQALADICVTRPFINASFALHHIADSASGHDQRGPVLRRLRALGPACLVLSEPEVDHLEPGFAARFENCFRHFGAVFRLLDELHLTQAERDALKVGFFGREIHDVLATPQAQRSERHETSAMWLRRLAQAGFSAQAAGAELLPTRHPAVTIQAQGPCVVLKAGGEPLVSVMVATAGVV